MVSTIPIPLTGFRAIFVGTLLLLALVLLATVVVTDVEEGWLGAADDSRIAVALPRADPLPVRSEVWCSARDFDAVINAALAQGVHFLTIEAQGLLAYRPGLDTNKRY